MPHSIECTDPRAMSNAFDNYFTSTAGKAIKSHL